MPMKPRLLVPRANFDADAAAYIRAVEAADTQALEAGVKRAIDNFVRGCKSDGIWTAIKASCILAGARTLTGALTPLVGTAPTNNGPFVSGDYDRKTGLVGNGSSKFLDTNRNNNTDSQNDKHMAVWQTTHQTRTVSRTVLGNGTGAAGDSQLLTTASARFYRLNYTGASALVSETATTAGFWGVARQSSANVQARFGGSTSTLSDASSAPTSGNIRVFSRDSSQFSDARIAFYSIGSHLDLALLDSRVSAYISAIGAAI